MTEGEWELFCDVLLELYYMEDVQSFGKKCLELIKIFIPYTQGYFVILDDNKKIDVNQSVFMNLEEERKAAFVKEFFYKDYLMDICNFTKSRIYRDTDLLSDDRRISTEFYQSYFKPQGLDKGCGLVVIYGKRVQCFLNMVRKKGEPDISEREMEILQKFLVHFEKNILHMLKEKAHLGHMLDLRKGNFYGLSQRELEVIDYVNRGYSNQEIGEELNISVGTVKKHLSNIFKKTGISRRTQL